MISAISENNENDINDEYLFQFDNHINHDDMNAIRFRFALFGDYLRRLTENEPSVILRSTMINVFTTYFENNKLTDDEQTKSTRKRIKKINVDHDDDDDDDKMLDFSNIERGALLSMIEAVSHMCDAKLIDLHRCEKSSIQNVVVCFDEDDANSVDIAHYVCEWLQRRLDVRQFSVVLLQNETKFDDAKIDFVVAILCDHTSLDKKKLIPSSQTLLALFILDSNLGANLGFV